MESIKQIKVSTHSFLSVNRYSYLDSFILSGFVGHRERRVSFAIHKWDNPSCISGQTSGYSEVLVLAFKLIKTSSLLFSV